MGAFDLAQRPRLILLLSIALSLVALSRANAARNGLEEVKMNAAPISINPVDVFLAFLMVVSLQRR
jgi:hypothetical protein